MCSLTSLYLSRKHGGASALHFRKRNETGELSSNSGTILTNAFRKDMNPFLPASGSIARYPSKVSHLRSVTMGKVRKCRMSI